MLQDVISFFIFLKNTWQCYAFSCINKPYSNGFRCTVVRWAKKWYVLENDFIALLYQWGCNSNSKFPLFFGSAWKNPNCHCITLLPVNHRRVAGLYANNSFISFGCLLLRSQNTFFFFAVYP